ncbi:MAG: SatD family protein [Balneolaceae bacterium]
MKLYAVITGDIVDSSKITKEEHSLLLDTLKSAFEDITSLYADKKEEAIPFDIFRGDSFQGLIPHPESALAASLLIRASLRKNQPESSAVSWDARTAIGIGTIDYPPKNISEGDGEAYRRSGPLLDKMKTHQRLSIITPWKEMNEEMNVQAALMDAVIAKWSPEQAEIVLELLEGKSRKLIGQQYGISQAAVHYRVKGAAWSAVEKFLHRYEFLIKQKWPE